jgi:hypothetical protein
LQWGFTADELLGSSEDLGSTEKKEKEEKLSLCPNCGHKF